MKEWNGLCPKCKSDNIDCTGGVNYESNWHCDGCGHNFKTDRITVLVAEEEG